MTVPAPDMRWKQRYENFSRAFGRLGDALSEKPLDSFSDLEKEGIVQRFEYTFELAWKTLKDYLVFTGIVLEQITPRHVIRQAFSAGLIPDGQGWIDMLEQRNLLSHRYDRQTFETAVAAISGTYLKTLEQVHTALRDKS